VGLQEGVGLLGELAAVGTESLDVLCGLRAAEALQGVAKLKRFDGERHGDGETAHGGHQPKGVERQQVLSISKKWAWVLTTL